MLKEACYSEIYIACGYTDLRKGIDGLAAWIQQQFDLNPHRTGAIFLFCGRKNDRIKALVWEGDGFLLLYKRVAEGYYELDDEVYRNLEVEPAVFKVIEHHIKVYKGKNGTIIKGKLVCDGYQVYHTLENDSGTDFTVAGCWIHARRPFADVIKSLGQDKAAGTLAYEAYVQIQNIYHTDNALKKLPPSDRKKKRKKLVKPLVDEFFDWAGKAQYAAAGSDKTRKGIQYCLNQEKYLRAFLDDPAIPLDNNLAEQAIRPFCVGRNNWKLIDTVGGANASAIIYSIVETAKANELNIYKYLKYLLTEIPQHMDDTDTDFIEDLLPWSKSLPPDCRKKKASN